MSSTRTPATSMRLDPELKASAKEVFESMGLSMTAGVTLYLKNVVQSRELPFSVKASDEVGSLDASAENGVRR